MLARIVPVFEGLEGETPRFYPLRAPDDPDGAAVGETGSRRTQALGRKNGIGASDDGEAEDPLMRDTPWLAGLYAHGVRGRIATRPNTGKRIPTWGGGGESEEAEPSARRCANVDGFSVHAVAAHGISSFSTGDLTVAAVYDRRRSRNGTSSTVINQRYSYKIPVTTATRGEPL